MYPGGQAAWDRDFNPRRTACANGSTLVGTDEGRFGRSASLADQSARALVPARGPHGAAPCVSGLPASRQAFIPPSRATAPWNPIIRRVAVARVEMRPNSQQTR